MCNDWRRYGNLEKSSKISLTNSHKLLLYNINKNKINLVVGLEVAIFNEWEELPVSAKCSKLARFGYNKKSFC